MVGPSSSHTAGACRIGWAGRALLGAPPSRALISLHGSFFATGEGHGTREALAAGLLGMSPDDERLKDALNLAQAAGLDLDFQAIDLGPQAHSNSVRLDLQAADHTLNLTASSVGGGSILLTDIDGLPTEVHGTLETLVLWHRDTSGFLARVTAVLACAEINVASIRTSRRERGEEAITAVEIDGSLPPEVPALLQKNSAIFRISVLPILPGF